MTVPPPPDPAEKDNSDDSERKIGPFRIGKQLGVGGMGIVYQATYIKNGAQVALKILSPMLSADEKLQARFEREMSILKKLKHPHIVKYYGGGKYKTQNYYAMELLLGGTVESELETHGKLPWERVLEIGIQVASALHHSHDKGIIHRDLKPANLFLKKNGQLKLGDFGIARDTQDTALTAAGRTVGTYAYMAPEQIVGKPPISKRTDLYALGCVLYELLTGHPPFEEENQADMFMAHINDDPPPLRQRAIDCPVMFEQYIMRLMEKNPEDRPIDALQVHTQFSEMPQKVAQQASVAKQTMKGGATALATQQDRKALKKALGKKKKKKEEPFYEKIWFLVACLLLIVGGITWAVWPMSEEKLIAAIEAGMKSENAEDWRATRDEFILPYEERFPDGEHHEKNVEYLDRIEIHNLKVRLDKDFSRGREPKEESHRRILEAMRYERFGDPYTALEKYGAIVTIFKSQEDDKYAVAIARQEIHRLENDSDSSDKTKAVNAALERAEKHFSEGEGGEAMKIWRNVIKLYQDKPEFAPQVKQARLRLDGKSAPAPDTKSTTETSSE